MKSSQNCYLDDDYKRVYENIFKKIDFIDLRINSKSNITGKTNKKSKMMNLIIFLNKILQKIV